MKYRITDSMIPDEEVTLEINLDEIDDEPEVTEEQAELLLDWWNDIPGRNYQVLEDGGYIIAINTDLDSGIPMIGVWAQETTDETWPLSGFPFGSLRYEAAPVRPCKECGEETDGDPGEPGFTFRDGTVMCQSCTHNAYRSGWNGSDE